MAIFPHRWDFIHKGHGFQTQWQTETRHSLSDRLIEQGASLYGVRFGKMTQYAMLDIDDDSLYHPNNDPYAISRLILALAPIGIQTHLPITSSYSGGIHLYLPLSEPVPTYTLARAIHTLITGAGFTIAGGTLELFPNLKTSPDQRYNAHRLPMQHGSYLLDHDLAPISGDRDRFVTHWRFAQTKNLTSTAQLDQVIRQYHRNDYQLTHSAKKFLQDLDAEIEAGWTDRGQTNHIIGRIALRGYVFGHIADGTDPLTDRRLVRHIIETARALPGFTEHCGHVPELLKRAEEWARCVEASPRYFPYGGEKSDLQPRSDSNSGNLWNILQMQIARVRIKEGISALLNRNALPTNARDRAAALTAEQGLSHDTLYKHRDLWHPDHLFESPPIEPPPTSLLPLTGWITLPDATSRRSHLQKLYKEGGSPLWDWLLDTPDPKIPIPESLTP